MNRLYKISFLLFFIFSSLHARTLWACRLTSDYLQPSNYELVKTTEVIILAEAVAFKRKERNTGDFRFNVLQILKGSFRNSFLISSGSDDFISGSKENDFSSVRSGVSRVACEADDYRIGHKYLLFMNRGKSGWSISGPPFTRINEEVDSQYSPWVTAVKYYIRISSLNSYEKEKTELKKLRAKALKGDNTAKYPASLISDIDSHFSTPSENKSYEDLMSLYRKASSDYERETVLWALANGKHPKAVPLFRSMIENGSWKDYIIPVCEYISVVKEAGNTRILASAFLRYKQECESGCPPGNKKCISYNCKRTDYQYSVLNALVELGDKKDKDIMLAVLKRANEREAFILSKWFVRNYSADAIRIIQDSLNKKYIEKQDVTLALARIGDNEVLKWAEEHIKTETDEHRWLSYYVIAISPLPEANLPARKIIHGNYQKGIIWLVQGYGKSYTGEHKWIFLKEISALKQKSEELKICIRRTLERMADRGETTANKLLNKSAR
ncbi:MAG: hypothetical protein GY749_28450 [Desulfobacteraceae bacterium]|nr:hypothetical protein [Desulfobacteraceae bacterium]